MAKRLFLFLFALVVQTTVYAQQAQNAQMEVKNFHDASGSLGNLTSMFMNDAWKYDQNGEPSAIVRIFPAGMSVQEMKSIGITGSANAGIANKEFSEEEQCWTIAMSTDPNTYLEFTHPTYGRSKRLSLPELKAGHIYDVTLLNNRTTSISVTSLPAGADVYLDGAYKGKTPCEIPGQCYGKHKLKLLMGDKWKEEDIQVEEGHTLFEGFDFRERCKVNITSDPTDASIYVDGDFIGRAPLYGCELLSGPHTIKAVLNSWQVDEQNVNVSTSTDIRMHPVKKGNVAILTRYAGRSVSAQLVVDNNQSYYNQNSYNVTLPYGYHSFRVSYNGKTKEKRINVSKPEQTEIFKLSAKNDIVWPWQREHAIAPVGFSLAYVTKQFVTTGEGLKIKDNGVWDDGKNKSLNGMQVGLHFQPCFKFGLGLYTGLFYELYMSFNDRNDYKQFMEHCAYVPVHLYYRIPFARKVALSVHGGVGCSYAFYGAYSTGDDDYEDYTDFYGEDAFPQRLNIGLEVGAGLRLGPVQLNFQYSKGLNDHKSYSNLGDYKTVCNKFTFGLSYMFSAE